MVAHASNENFCRPSTATDDEFGFFLFANDHEDHLPGNWYDHANPDPEKRDWLCNTVDGTGWSCEPTTTPMDGTLFKYVKNKKIYLCPFRDVSLGACTPNSSNGF